VTPGGTPTPLRLVVASANPDKVKEIVAVLSEALDVELVPRPEDVPEVVEDGATLVDNARLKARALMRATGTAAVADDTGLEVDALGGAPGVYAARYAGGGERRARFKSIAFVAFRDGAEVWAEGVMEGTIAAAPRGDNGFGYDPVFEPDGGDGRTFAEMTAAEKDAMSHRGRAFRSLARMLAEGPEGAPPS
jgi:XTP/dITP diphosphohydrolase